MKPKQVLRIPLILWQLIHFQPDSKSLNCINFLIEIPATSNSMKNLKICLKISFEKKEKVVEKNRIFHFTLNSNQTRKFSFD